VSLADQPTNPHEAMTLAAVDELAERIAQAAAETTREILTAARRSPDPAEVARHSAIYGTGPAELLGTDPGPSCLFCSAGSPENQIVAEYGSCYARLDNYPSAPGHIEVVPRRHVVSLWDLTTAELVDAYTLLRSVALTRGADGWTVGVNEGHAAGRTLDHLHIHLIPRRHGDVPDPRGGIRAVLPGPHPSVWAGPRPPADVPGYGEHQPVTDPINRVRYCAADERPWPCEVGQAYAAGLATASATSPTGDPTR
jgi:diadenosine tetraphosphate (Ap4A) HIT family hydrolase